MSTNTSNSVVLYGEESRITVASLGPRPRTKPAPKDPAELKKQRDERAQVSTNIAEAMDAWHEEIRLKAQSLASQFGKTSQYFLARLYNKPTQVKSSRETNLRNAWAWKLSQDKTTSTCLLSSL